MTNPTAPHCANCGEPGHPGHHWLTDPGMYVCTRQPHMDHDADPPPDVAEKI